MTQSIKHRTLGFGSGCDLRICMRLPGNLFSPSAPPPHPTPHAHICALSLSKKKERKKERKKKSTPSYMVKKQQITKDQGKKS